ncbi:MAG: hypothetical protein P8X74_12310 [Reinekea sp.]
MPDKTPVGDMPRMVPDRDDIRSRSPSKTQTTTERKPAASAPAEKQGGHNWVLLVLVILSGVAIGYLSLQQYSMTQLQKSYEERLDLADQRIVGLERSLTETDESVSMNGTAINAQFKAIKSETDAQMSEIRKLWDVTNKRNRTWIEENQAALKTQTQNLDTALANLAKVIDTQKKDASVIGTLNSTLNDNKVQVTELQAALTDLKSKMNSVEQSVQGLLSSGLEEQLLTLTLNQENMLAEQNKVAVAASDNTGQIDSILNQLKALDANRLETSRRLSALNGQIETLSSRLTELTGTGP